MGKWGMWGKLGVSPFCLTKLPGIIKWEHCLEIGQVQCSDHITFRQVLNGF